MCTKLKNDIPVCQIARRLSCSDNPSPMKTKQRRFSVLHGSTAADSVQSGWPDVVSSRSRAKRNLRAQAQLSESRTETLGLLRTLEKSEQRKTELNLAESIHFTLVEEVQAKTENLSKGASVNFVPGRMQKGTTSKVILSR
ncbi:hypothetical protein TNCV_3918281 [Trichonephila clavipes]|nr:hypothetical protein TNCV_3918281 [Trichonephila clavipes]